MPPFLTGTLISSVDGRLSAFRSERRGGPPAGSLHSPGRSRTRAASFLVLASPRLVLRGRSPDLARCVSRWPQLSRRLGDGSSPQPTRAPPDHHHTDTVSETGGTASRETGGEEWETSWSPAARLLAPEQRHAGPAVWLAMISFSCLPLACSASRRFSSAQSSAAASFVCLSVAMGYSTNSGPFWVGSLVFLILGVLACFISSALAKVGRNQYLGSDDTRTQQKTHGGRRRGPLPRLRPRPLPSPAEFELRIENVHALTNNPLSPVSVVQPDLCDDHDECDLHVDAVGHGLVDAVASADLPHQGDDKLSRHTPQHQHLLFAQQLLFITAKPLARAHRRHRSSTVLASMWKTLRRQQSIDFYHAFSLRTARRGRSRSTLALALILRDMPISGVAIGCLCLIDCWTHAGGKS